MRREEMIRARWVGSPALFALISLVTTCGILLLLIGPSVHGITTATFTATGDQGLSVPAFSLFEQGRGSDLKRDGEDYSCDKDNPCGNGACCGSYLGSSRGTCGYGADYCGDDCTSNCDATSECGEFSNPPGKECPLNVCCSQWGFCGSTAEFCNAECQSNCELNPAIPAGKSSTPVLNRVIGYYEGWAARRDCYPFPPSYIPIQGLTHVNFAFAYIDPDSFQITPMDSLTPPSLFLQTADVRSSRSGNSGLEVFVSVGGWTFSDNDTATQPVFSDISSSAGNRQTFADNMLSFMKRYGFDGVDIDWEYPGATDRGGQEEVDIANFVALFRVLRQTFDASGRKFGLTFTIPSSYWYLRWFDVPGLLESADWVNLMSYDIHGVWDEHNPIGSFVHPHTNLTEIKLALDLLWRVNVPPEKIVLGLGFYGRSFHLKDSSCNEPGCAFSGDAEPGECTNNAGSLAYFEIMDILDKQKPNVIHDKEIAAKYFQYGAKKDQWISFDDKDTFKQKVDWADEIGLGGVMVWSVDQDDEDFSALSGLLGKDLPVNEFRRAEVDDGQWASHDYQKCKMTECLKDDEKGSWGQNWMVAPGGDAFRDNCDQGENKYIICPPNSVPSSCKWRGGETGCTCHGQCHTGEVTLFHSRRGSKYCCTPGEQAFCCESNTWSGLVDSCEYSSDDTCPFNKIQISYRNNYVCDKDLATQYCGFDKLALCCDVEFPNCHWIGKGTCDDNECADWEIELDTDEYGDTKQECAAGLNGRKKVLCCKPPADLNPFLPVPLEYLFPTLPPVTSVPNFDLQNIKSAPQDSGEDSSPQAFGMVVIDGPPGSVTTLSKRDGSHVEFLDCEPTKKHEVDVYTARYICMDDSSESNCDDVHLGGAKGTIIRLPEECGYATYGVVHDIRSSENASISHDLRKRAPEGALVYELEFSYDFSLVKRDDDSDVFIRIDYAHNRDYWDEIVAAKPVTKRSLNQTLDKRFWSPDASIWKSLISDVRDESLPGGYRPSLVSNDFDRLLYQQDNSDDCDGGGFLSVKLKGSISDAIRWGFTLVGRITPTLSLEEAYGYFDSELDLDATLEVASQAAIKIPGRAGYESLFNLDISGLGFSHPGLVKFSPKLNVEVDMSGEGELDSKFSVDFRTQSDGRIKTHAPLSMLGSMTGGVKDSTIGHAVEGSISGSSKATGSDDTILAVDLDIRSWMDVSLFELGTGATVGKAEFSSQMGHYVRVTGEGGTVKVIASNKQASVEAYSAGISAGWEEDDQAHLVGDKGSPATLYSGAGDDPDDNKPPNWNGNAVFGDDFVGCLLKKKLKCWDSAYLAKFDPDLLLDPDTGLPFEKRSDGTHGQIDPRGVGKGREFTVRAPSGTSFVITSHEYYNGQNGAFLQLYNPHAGYYTLLDPENCEVIGFTKNGDTDDTSYVSEHIVELSYLAEVLRFMLSGTASNPDFSTERDSVPENILNSNGPFQKPWNTWDPNGKHANPSMSPIDAIWEAFGSRDNPEVMVNAEKVFNGIKMRAWRGQDPFSDATWAANNWHDTSESEGMQRAQEAISAIRTVISLFEYLNHDDIMRNRDRVFNEIDRILEEFDEAVARARQVPIQTSPLNREFLHYYLFPRVENVENWVDRRIEQMQTEWRTALSDAEGRPGPSSRIERINEVLTALERLKEGSEERIILRSGDIRGPPTP